MADQNSTPIDASDILNYEPGVLAAIEISNQPDQQLNDLEVAAIKELRQKASKKDYPARITEVIESWEARLFYRGFQFLEPNGTGGGFYWSVPGEDSGYGPAMQAELGCLPTNIYSSYGQMIIAALTREVPATIFIAQDNGSDKDITAADSADNYVKVFERDNDLLGIQTDKVRYLWTDGRSHYWTRHVKDGQKFGWEEDDEPEVVPEDAPPKQSQETQEAPQVAATNDAVSQNEGQQPTDGTSANDDAATPSVTKQRTPRGQEVRTAYGKLEVKVEMRANELEQTYFLKFCEEVDVSTAKGMFPKKADKIKEGGTGLEEGEIEKLARVNCKLGMQASYVTSDSSSSDVTIDRTWFRPSAFTGVKDKAVRASLLEKFPDGVYVCYAGDVFCFARNESMDWSWEITQAYSGDGQNRNALGTSLIPVQKRLNDWLDLMNSIFLRTIGRRVYDNVAFNQKAVEGTVAPGDTIMFQRQPGVPLSELMGIEPQVNMNAALPDFVKEYSGELSQLLTGAFPALFGGNTGSNDTAQGIGIQRDAALGRIGPTWHSIKAGESISMKQAVRWAAKCRDGSINESIPGGDAIKVEVNDLNGNILAFAESDENIPESYSSKQARIIQLFQDSAKNPELAEVFNNPANLEVVQQYMGFSDIFIPQVDSYKKQLGEIEVLIAPGNGPAPNPALIQAQQTIEHLMTVHGVDPQMLIQAQQEMEQLPPEVSTVHVDALVDDSEVHAETCKQFLNSPKGRKLMKENPNGYSNVRLHLSEHEAIVEQNQQSNAKVAESLNFKDLPPAAKVQEAGQAGIKLNPADVAQAPIAKQPPQA